MTRPKPSPLVLVAALAVAGAVTLLWCAWLVLTAPLPNGAAAAAWTLWLLSVAAVVTVVAYLREMVRHGRLADRASWKPLPGLVLLWAAGLTALAAFPFVLPQRTGGPTSVATADAVQPAPEATNAGPVDPPRTAPSSVSRAGRSTSQSSITRAPGTTSSRSPVTSATTTAPTTAPSSASSTRPPGPTPSTSSPSSSSSTTSPLIEITLPRGTGRPGDKPPPPGHGG